jgi:signal transduction histidine kinase
LNRVIERLTPAILEHQGHVTVKWSPEAASAEVDPHRIEQVFENLWRMPSATRHQAKLSWWSRRSSWARKSRSYFPITVRIPYGDQPHIFERFYRVQNRSRKRGGGTGLGLSIVRHIVLAHDGSVAVESAPGQGAAFKIRLPVARQATAKAQVAES